MKFGLTNQEISTIRKFLKKFPQVQEALIFGSRATNTFKSASDIDIAIKGDIDFSTLNRLKDELEENIPVPFFFDVVDVDKVKDEKLKNMIQKQGVIFYQKDRTGKINRFKETEIGMISEDWATTSLGEVGELKNGVNFRRNDFGEGYPIINVTNLFRGRYATIEDLDEIKKDTIRNPEKYFVRKGDILFTRSSLKHSGTGQSAMVFNLPNKPTLFSGFIIRFRKHENSKINDEFLNYLVRSDLYRTYIRKLISGTTITNITQGFLSSLPVIIPDIPEQSAIAKILSDFDSKIELNQLMNKTLEAIGQAIFKRWFIDFEFPNEKGEPYKSSGGKMIDSELGKIPEGWKVGRLKDLIDILSGFAFSSGDFNQEGKYKLVTIKNVQDKYFDPKTKDKLSKLPEQMPIYCKLETGDILLSLTGNVGRVCLVNGEDFLLNQRVAKLKPKNEMDYAFTYLLFLQNSIFSTLQGIASGTAQQNLSPIQTKEIEIIIADRKTLDQFGAIANKLIQKINSNNSQIQTLSSLRDTLLPKLMKGDLRVTCLRANAQAGRI